LIDSSNVINGFGESDDLDVNSGINDFCGFVLIDSLGVINDCGLFIGVVVLNKSAKFEFPFKKSANGETSDDLDVDSNGIDDFCGFVLIDSLDVIDVVVLGKFCLFSAKSVNDVTYDDRNNGASSS
jgi:hypothetical protein